MIKRYESNGRLNKVVIANGFAFLSGITAKDTSGDVGAQTADILKQIDGYLVQAGTSKDKLVSANIWLSTMSDAAGMNAVWQSWIDPETARGFSAGGGDRDQGQLACLRVDLEAGDAVVTAVGTIQKLAGRMKDQFRG